MVDPIAVGIKKIIAEKGLVQGTVARRAGFSAQQLSNMVNNRRVIKACDLIPISAALGVEIPEIFAAGQENK